MWSLWPQIIFIALIACVQRVDEYQEAEYDQHPREVHVLAGHSDIIRIVARVDDKRYIVCMYV